MPTENQPSTALTINLQQSIQNIADKFPEEAKTLRAFVSKDVRALGVDDIFTLRDNQGEIRAFKQALTLSSSAGTLIQPVPGGPFVMSAQGYEVWSETAGASVIFPKEVLVDGQWQANPSVIRDPSNRRILCIYARAVAFRFSSKGIPQVSDWSTIFDTPSYRLIDLLGKAKKYPQAFRLLPAADGKPDFPGTWASYPFDESTCLWVNTAHDEALSWFAQILNREKKAIDFAQTFAKRNALKHLSGIQKAPHDNWTIPVICWRPTNGNIIKWDATTYANLQARAGGLISSRGEDFQPGGMAQIECKAGAERVSDEPGFEGEENQIDPEDREEIIEGEVLETRELTEDQRRTLANYAETREQFPAEFAQACRELKIPDPAKADPRTAETVIRRVGAILDSMAAA
jgi:hypothetical protein